MSSLFEYIQLFQVKVGTDDFIHLRIYTPLPPNHDNHVLHSVQTGKTEHEPIGYF